MFIENTYKIQMDYLRIEKLQLKCYKMNKTILKKQFSFEIKLTF